MLLSQFPSTFLHTQRDMLLFMAQLFDCFRADGDVLCNHPRDVPWKDFVILDASATASGFLLLAPD